MPAVEQLKERPGVSLLSIVIRRRISRIFIFIHESEFVIMKNQENRLYPYRWVVLAVFMFVNLMVQLLWVSYAPITGPAAKF